MRLSSRNIWTVAAAGIAVSLAGAAAGPASAAAHQPLAHPYATGYSTSGQLNSVGAASDGNAWAVGHTESGKVLLVHWNGASWSRVTSPSALTGTGSLAAITVVNAKDAWAVGSGGSSAHPHSLIMHWNGVAWTEVTSPAPVANGSLYAVTANAKGGWAVGTIQGPSVVQTSTLIFRLSKGKWSRSDSKFGKDSGVSLDGVATTSTGRTFATGLFTGMITGEIARWTGHSWAWVKSFPEEGTYHWLNAIAAGRHGVAFAVGLNTASAPIRVISIRWTGHAWVKAPAPSSANLYATAVTHSGTAWAAGSYQKGVRSHELILRWNGHAWKRVAAPSTVGLLDGLGFATAKYGWAVGYTEPSSGSPKTLIVHWNGHSWS